MQSDDELVRGFEAADLAAFPHADHVRLTTIYLRRHGRDETLRLLMAGLRRFAVAKGVPEKFHVTITRAWMELVADAVEHHAAADVNALLTAWPLLADKDALLMFYSRERLFSDEARAQWVPPDLRPIAGSASSAHPPSLIPHP